MRSREIGKWYSDDKRLSNAINLAIEGLFCDGGHHKQWYLEEVLRALGVDLAVVLMDEGDWEDGKAP